MTSNYQQWPLISLNDHKLPLLTSIAQKTSKFDKTFWTKIWKKSHFNNFSKFIKWPKITLNYLKLHLMTSNYLRWPQMNWIDLKIRENLAKSVLWFLSPFGAILPTVLSTYATVFENHPKCRIWIFGIFHPFLTY